MTEKLTPIPEGFHTITPHLVVREAAKAIDFYKRAFGAEVVNVSPGPGGRIIHATVKIGDSMLMLNDEFPEWNLLSPLAFNGSSVTIHLYVEDVDSVFNRAIAAGGTVTMPVQNQFWGARYGTLKDPFGHNWSVATRVENVTPEEMRKRSQESLSKQQD